MFLNRADAAHALATKLAPYKQTSDTLVVALTRGGVVLGDIIARVLNLPLDIMIVRKIGAPDNPEFAIGALSENGAIKVNNDVIVSYGIAWYYIDDQILREKKEIERQSKLYRSHCPALPVKEKTVIIVDDGLATGYTMQVAIADLRTRKAKNIIVAVPVGPQDTVSALSSLANEVITLLAPSVFFAVGHYYVDFEPVTDQEVVLLLENFPKEGGGI